MNAASRRSLTIREFAVRGAQGPLPARLYQAAAPGAKYDGLIVFFHSGGFVGGTLDDADPFLRELVQRTPDHAVLACSYTLATVRPFPAAAEDAHAALLWVQKNKARLGWSGKRLVTAGIEAGANLAAVCTLMARDRGGPPLAGQILIMPMLDPALSTCSMRDLPADASSIDIADSCALSYRDYLPNVVDRSHPYASPLQSSRLKNLPPALILSAEDDPLRDEAEQYGTKLAACGIATTVKRLAPAPLQDPGARNECACKDSALTEIAGFVARLKGPDQPAPPLA